MRHFKNLTSLPPLLLITLFLLVVITGCATSSTTNSVRNTARAKVGLEVNSQQLIITGVKGSLPVNDWLETRSNQEAVNAQASFLRKSQQAANDNNFEEAQQWLDLAQQTQEGSKTVIVRLVNLSHYRAIVLDGPFAGEVLESGQSSKKTARMNVGVSSFRVLGGTSIGQDKEVVVTRHLSVGDNQIVLVNRNY